MKETLMKIAGVIVFIAGGLIGGDSQMKGTFFYKLSFLGPMIAFFVCAIGVWLFRSSNYIDDKLKDEA